MWHKVENCAIIESIYKKWESIDEREIVINITITIWGNVYVFVRMWQ